MTYDMVNAIADVKCGMSVRKAAKKWNVGRTTLLSRLKDDKIKESIKQLNELHHKVNATLFLYDMHIPYVDSIAFSAAIDFAKNNYNVVHIVLGGDVIDCESLSKFDKSRNTVSFINEVHEAKSYFDVLRNKFSDAKMTYIMGNHEERLEKYVMKNAPELKGIADSMEYILDLHRYSIDFVNNRELKSKTGHFFKVNDFTIIHGHELDICPIVSPAYKFLEKAKENLILGHIHCPDERFSNTINGNVLRCYSVGTLAKITPMYKPFNSWGHGFCVMEHREDGDMVRNLRIFDGKIY